MIQYYNRNKKSGLRLKRAGMSQRVFQLVDEFNENRTYKNAIALAGRLNAIAQAASSDSYWNEKCGTAFRSETDALEICDIESGKTERKTWWVE